MVTGGETSKMPYFTGDMHMDGSLIENVTIQTSEIKTSTLDMNGQVITSHGDPIQPEDVSNKRYVDQQLGSGFQVYTVQLVGTTPAVVVNLAPGSYTMHVQPVSPPGPVAAFIVLKAQTSLAGYVVDHHGRIPGNPERLEITWPANNSVYLSKTGTNYDGMYKVKII